MVTTRRNAAAPAGPSQAAAAMDQSVAVPSITPAKRRVGRKVISEQSETQTQTPSSSTTTATSRTSVATAAGTTTTTTTSTNTTRRLRSKQTASPLAAVEEPKRTALKASAPKPKAQSKRKRDTPSHNIVTDTSASATPEPEPQPEPAQTESEPAQEEDDDEQGIFFTQSIYSLVPAEILQLDSLSSPVSPPLYSQFLAEAPVDDEVTVLRQENSQLLRRISKLETTNDSHVQDKKALHYHIDCLNEDNVYLRTLLAQLQTGQVQANQTLHESDFGIDLSMDTTESSPARPEFITGDESALALLHKIESRGRESRLVSTSHMNGERFSNDSPFQRPERRLTKPEGSPTVTDTTPARPISTPSSFFSRSFSAIKSKLGFAPSTPSAPSPAPPSTPRTRAPPPDTIIEALSVPPTPVGERSKATPKKKRHNPMFKLFTKGIEPSELREAEQWVKHVIPTLKNDPAYREKRKRLETPVLIKDLENFPSSKPWETGFGDPLGDMDDDDVVPVWAVYLDMLAEEEQPQAKRRKANHGDTMDVDDTLSINDLFAASNSAQTSPTLHDSHGHTASIHDFHPRRSIEPSPMFESRVSHQEGQNIFRERQGHEVSAQLHADDRESLHQATKKVVPTHDPSQGSFGLDYDSDEEDTTMISETSETDNTTATPVWTQAPPPAPTPAHAPLPSGLVAESPAVPTVQQPVDEVERQRQKLMKHTPAKPSRLREAYLPSPSLRSDAGNDSILMASPLPATDLFDDMPGAEDLGLTEEEWAGVRAYQNSAEWKAADAANVWPDAILTYGSEEEDLSPI